MKNRQPIREVIFDDALIWLNQHRVTAETSFVASLPDKSEFPKFTLNDWKTWFGDTAELIIKKTPPEGIAIFYQSDIKVEGTWIDKSFLIMKAAERQNAELLFHKIICRTLPGILTLGRPAYSHLIGFSRNFRMPENCTLFADVVPDIGEKTWQRGMGLNACLGIADFLEKKTTTKTLINPFCGEGSMLAAANARGLDAIGIERSPKRVQKAQHLQLDETETSWVFSHKES